MDIEQGSQSKPTASKVFLCSFCKRKFYISQELGGHRNTHTRVRGAIKRYQCERHMASISLLASKPIFQSLGVHSHPLVHKTSREWDLMIARFKKCKGIWGEPDSNCACGSNNCRIAR
jgi:hypothetical protein